MDIGKPRVSDEELSALLDGELDACRAESLLTAVVRDPELAGRLGRLAAVAAGLRLLERGVLKEPIPARVEETLRRGARPAHSD